MIRGIVIIVGSFFFYSCKQSIPSDIIKPREMQVILWDIIRADALAKEMANRDSSLRLADHKSGLTRKALLIHNITPEQFEKSYSYYIQHPDKMKIILDSLNAQQVRAATRYVPLKKPEGVPQKIN